MCCTSTMQKRIKKRLLLYCLSKEVHLVIYLLKNQQYPKKVQMDFRKKKLPYCLKNGKTATCITTTTTRLIKNKTIYCNFFLHVFLQRNDRSKILQINKKYLNTNFQLQRVAFVYYIINYILNNVMETVFRKLYRGMQCFEIANYPSFFLQKNYVISSWILTINLSNCIYCSFFSFKKCLVLRLAQKYLDNSKNNIKFDYQLQKNICNLSSLVYITL